jgi:hypothetical protein
MVYRENSQKKLIRERISNTIIFFHPIFIKNIENRRMKGYTNIIQKKQANNTVIIAENR